MIWILVCIVPLLIPFFLKYKNPNYSWKELLICCCASVLLSIGVICLSTYYGMIDTQILSGRVTDKIKESVSCEHSYSCNCIRTCNGKSCSTHCSTCYEHSNDYDYNIHSTIGTFTINRIDRQGNHEPPRFTLVKKEDAVAKTDTYINYIKGAKNSLFNMKDYSDSSLVRLPEYPLEIYDYYKINRTIVDGVTIPDKSSYDDMLSELLKKLGETKQVNVVLVFTNQDRLFAEKLKTKWLNGKKNDTIIVIGTKDYPNIEWVYVFGWSNNQMLNIALRDDLIEHKVITVTGMRDSLTKNLNMYYSRKPMSDFEYLKNSSEPSMVVLTTAFILTMIFSIGFSYIAIKD